MLWYTVEGFWKIDFSYEEGIFAVDFFIEWRIFWVMIILTEVWRFLMKAVCSGDINLGMYGWRRLIKILVNILYIVL